MGGQSGWIGEVPAPEIELLLLAPHDDRLCPGLPTSKADMSGIGRSFHILLDVDETDISEVLRSCSDKKLSSFSFCSLSNIKLVGDVEEQLSSVQ